ncbi:adenosylmethionine--8-amino-7-oxononanoate transaminase [Altibacter sp.]|uniref:adenosylmethionine--8-amino-7-oxononanoate transaminase n=1 Tax=Altibacter sp. TaxID=2024823 RepID=UPI000C92F2F2|nr:adenosylmethionine--8-amino-7-oxononanoate transaminase [Altibacter sp.]MAP53620.1 adenosylmethionine--8-amino-7-oxononanoate transaminase [Altibacter sp.]
MSLQQRDKKHIWHPLTQHQTAAPPIAIVKAKGALLWDEDGKEYIDGIASWYTAMYGHCNDHIITSVSKQLKELDQVVFTGFTHEPAVQLSERLMAILPPNQQKLFFNDNGSTAVEAGIKMALQYHYNKGAKRDTLIAFEEGFHGDTFGAMSVSGLSVYNGPFEEFFLKVVRIATPTTEQPDALLAQLEEILENNNCAAFVYEPLVQGAAGMKFHNAMGLEQLLKRCKHHDVLCIADEVMTGFGKTGRNFASEYLDTPPDIMCLSKALTAGVAAMSVTTCTQQVFDAFLGETISKGFFHAHTYSANPLACSAAIAGLELLTSNAIQDDGERIYQKHCAFAKRIKKHPKVASVRTMGLIFALDLALETDRYGAVRDLLFAHFMERGVFLRPLGNTIYILPPFVTTDQQLEQIYGAVESCLPLV